MFSGNMIRDVDDIVVALVLLGGKGVEFELIWDRWNFSLEILKSIRCECLWRFIARALKTEAQLLSRVDVCRKPTIHPIPRPQTILWAALTQRGAGTHYPPSSCVWLTESVPNGLEGSRPTRRVD
ncbi:hypothetical protein NPIL_255781 [Nephila pilipes]|uniref:Uncharacterized protein n=1 Tax=Nephila pilipes TaxID=299642 RepID=A0A8X6PYE6_NEPPI|nr:hypothetical protein NPIL_255781 [Nephila pilipes]